MHTIIRTTLMMILLFLSENTLVYGSYGRHTRQTFCNYDMIVTLGIMALIGLVVTVFFGFKKSGSRKSNLQWHKNIAIFTIAVTTIHVISALIFH